MKVTVTVGFCGSVRCEIWVSRTSTAWCDANFRRFEIYGAVGTEVLFEGISVLLGS